MIDLDETPCCRDCGAPMIVDEFRNYLGGPDSVWSAECSEKEECWAILYRDERPTWRNEPGLKPLVEEIERLRAELADARLALAMARGEGWPDGWRRFPGHQNWISPDNHIVIGPQLLGRGKIDGWFANRDRLDQNGNWTPVDPKQLEPYPDALAALSAALRSCEAAVKP